MKNVKSTGRLQLNKETLRSLTPRQLARVVGATTLPCIPDNDDEDPQTPVTFTPQRTSIWQPVLCNGNTDGC